MVASRVFNYKNIELGLPKECEIDIFGYATTLEKKSCDPISTSPKNRLKQGNCVVIAEVTTRPIPLSTKNLLSQEIELSNEATHYQLKV